MRNEGIQVSGGSFNVDGALAVGRGALAQSSQDADADVSEPDLRKQLDALCATVERNASKLEDSTTAMADLRRLVAELDQAEPELDRVAPLLSRLRAGAGQVLEIASSLTAIEHLVDTVIK